MSSRPTLILPVNADGDMLLRQTDGQIHPFDQLSDSGLTCDLILPGQNVRIYAHELPKMREREKQAAARFAVEDRTAAALDEQHIVIGQNGDTRLAVIDSAVFSDAISRVESFGLIVCEVYADFDWIAGVSHPIVLSDRIIFSGPEGYTIDPEWADGEISKEATKDWTDITPSDTALSLRQGKFARQSRLSLPVASLSKIAALLVLTGISWLALQGAQARATSQQAENLNSQTAALYTQSTGQPAPANPARAVTRALKSDNTGKANFLPLISALNSLLAKSDNISVQSLSFDASKSQLNLRLIYPSFESAGELETAASQLGHEFSPGGVREQNGELIGDAVFELGAPL